MAIGSSWAAPPGGAPGASGSLRVEAEHFGRQVAGQPATVGWSKARVGGSDLPSRSLQAASQLDRHEGVHAHVKKAAPRGRGFLQPQHLGDVGLQVGHQQLVTPARWHLPHLAEEFGVGRGLLLAVHARGAPFADSVVP